MKATAAPILDYPTPLGGVMAAATNLVTGPATRAVLADVLGAAVRATCVGWVFWLVLPVLGAPVCCVQLRCIHACFV